MSDEDSRRLTLLENELADLKSSVLLALKAIRETRRQMQPIVNMRTDDQGRRLCHANALSTGLPCRAPAVAGAAVCRMHGAGKGSPGREKADNVMLRQLVGPALWRLKGLIDSNETTGPVLLSAIREVLDRTGYREYYEMTWEDVEPHLERLIQEAEEGMSPEEIAAARERSRT
jgi:hypothetical protein